MQSTNLFLKQSLAEAHVTDVFLIKLTVIKIYVLESVVGKAICLQNSFVVKLHLYSYGIQSTNTVNLLE